MYSTHVTINTQSQLNINLVIIHTTIAKQIKYTELQKRRIHLRIITFNKNRFNKLSLYHHDNALFIQPVIIQFDDYNEISCLCSSTMHGPMTNVITIISRIQRQITSLRNRNKLQMHYMSLQRQFETAIEYNG